MDKFLGARVVICQIFSVLKKDILKLSDIWRNFVCRYFFAFLFIIFFSISAQLPATVSSLAAKQQNFSISLFARLFKHFEFAEDSPIQHLYTQYRMASDIMAWPNQYFYGGKLKCGSQDRRCPIINYKVIFDRELLFIR